MKKLFYSVFITSLLAVGVAHAEDVNVAGTVSMSGTATPIATMMRIDPSMLRGAPEMTGSNTPSMIFPPQVGSGTPMCRKFVRPLSFGIKGDDVKELQDMLHENGFLNASSTGFFGKMTKDAVIKFQKEGGLNPSGYFGELSRKMHEKRCGQGGIKPGMMNGEGRGPAAGMGSGTPPMIGGNGRGTPVVGSGTPPMMPPPPCPAGAPCGPKATGTPPQLPPPHMGSGTPPVMGSGTPGMLPPPPRM